MYICEENMSSIDKISSGNTDPTHDNGLSSFPKPPNRDYMINLMEFLLPLSLSLLTRTVGSQSNRR